MNFETVANQYLQELETGSNPCRRSTLKSYQSILRTHLTPRYGSAELSELAKQNNCVLRQLVKELRGDYAPASILGFHLDRLDHLDLEIVEAISNSSSEKVVIANGALPSCLPDLLRFRNKCNARQ